jgi:hypothetical protein
MRASETQRPGELQFVVGIWLEMQNFRINDRVSGMTTL